VKPSSANEGREVRKTANSSERRPRGDFIRGKMTGFELRRTSKVA